MVTKESKKTIEAKLEESNKLFNEFEQMMGFIGIKGIPNNETNRALSVLYNGIKALYLQNNAIVDYLREIYNSQEENKKD